MSQVNANERESEMTTAKKKTTTKKSVAKKSAPKKTDRLPEMEDHALHSAKQQTGTDLWYCSCGEWEWRHIDERRNSLTAAEELHEKHIKKVTADVETD